MDRTETDDLNREQPPAPLEQEIKDSRESGLSSGLKRLGSLMLPVVFLLKKFKWLLVILKATKLSTLITMVIAVWAYAQIWGVRYAVGFVLLIYVHEMGHVLAMRKMGIKATAPVFIPFVGAVISMKDIPKSALVESLVAIGGPFLGMLGAAVCLAVGMYTGSLFWFALASTGFMLNLFNMLPVSPLDGGRITGVISRWFWLVGFVLGGAMFYMTRSPLLFLILLIGFITLISSVKKTRPDYYDVSGAARTGIAIAYFVLIFIMVIGMWMADQPLKGIAAS
jgi:Zn-dependent protease